MTIKEIKEKLIAVKNWIKSKVKKILITLGIVGVVLAIGVVLQSNKVFALDTGWKSPTALGATSTWNSPTNAYVSDNNYATTTGSSKEQHYKTFGFSIPTGNVINGIEMTCEAKTNAAGTIDYVIYQASVNAQYTKEGITWEETEQEYSAGGASDLWGGTWIVTDFSDANFYVKLFTTWNNTYFLDHIQVKVYYAEAATGTEPQMEVIIIE